MRLPLRSGAVVGLVVFLVLTVGGGSARAQTATNTWNGGTGGWNTAGNWTPGGVPVGGPATILGIGGAGYTATNDTGGPFSLNGLIFGNTGPIVLDATGGSSLNFLSNGTATPFISLAGSGSILVSQNASLASTLTITGAGSNVLTLGGALSGSGGLTVSTAGGVVLSGNNSAWTGATTVNRGTLTLDFTTDNNAKLANQVLTFGTASLGGGGALNILGSATDNTTQTVGGLTVNGGAYGISLSSQPGFTTTLNVTTLTLNKGSLLNVTLGGTGTSVLTTGTAGSGTVLGNVIVGGTAFGFSSATGTIVANTIEQDQNAVGSWAAGGDVTNATTGGYTGNTPDAANFTINSLKFANATAGTVQVGGATAAASQLTITTGGVLKLAGTTAATIQGGAAAAALTGPYLSTGSATTDLTVTNNGSTGLTIKTNIGIAGGAGGATPQALSLNANGSTGTITIGGTGGGIGLNFVTGGTYVNSGTVNFISGVAVTGTSTTYNNTSLTTPNPLGRDGAGIGTLTIAGGATVNLSLGTGLAADSNTTAAGVFFDNPITVPSGTGTLTLNRNGASVFTTKTPRFGALTLGDGAAFVYTQGTGFSSNTTTAQTFGTVTVVGGAAGQPTTATLTINGGFPSIGQLIGTPGGSTINLGGTASIVLNSATAPSNVALINLLPNTRVYSNIAGNVGTVPIAIGSGATFMSQVAQSLSQQVTVASGGGIGTRTATLTLSNLTGLPTAGTLILNNDNSATAAISLSGSWPALTGDLTLQIGGPQNVAANAIGATTITNGLDASGAGVAGTFTLTANYSPAAASTPASTNLLTINSLALGANNLVVAGTGTGGLNSASLTIGTITTTGAGTNSLTKNGVGTSFLTLTGAANTFSGGVTVNAGGLVLGASDTVAGGVITQGPLGTGALTLAAAGLTLRDSGATRTIHTDVTITGSATFDTTGTAYTTTTFLPTYANRLTLTDAGLTTPSTLTLTAATNPTYTVTNVTTWSQATTLSGGATGFTKAGTGLLVVNDSLAGVSTINVTAGSLQLTANASAPGLGAGSITLPTATVLALGPGTTTQASVNRLAAASAGVVVLGADTTANIDFSGFNGGGLRLGALGGGFVYGGTLTPEGTTLRYGGGGGTLYVTAPQSGAATTVNIGQSGVGAGDVFLLNGSNSQGGTTIAASDTNGAALAVKSDGALGDPAGGLTFSSSAATPRLILNGPVTVPNTRTFTVSGTTSNTIDSGTNTQVLNNAWAGTGTGALVFTGRGGVTTGTATPAANPVTVNVGGFDPSGNPVGLNTGVTGTPFGTAAFTLQNNVAFTTGGAVSYTVGGTGNVSYLNGTVSLGAGGNPGATLTLGGTVTRTARGTLVLAPANGTVNLGTAAGETYKFGTAPALANAGTIVQFVYGRDSDAAGTGTHLTYTANGFQPVTYTAFAGGNIDASTATTLADVTAAVTQSANATAYALRTNSAIAIGTANTLTVGGGGLVLNGTGITVSGGASTGGLILASESSIYTSGTATISAIIPNTNAPAINIVGPGVLTLGTGQLFQANLNIRGGTLAVAGFTDNTSTATGTPLGAGPRTITIDGGGTFRLASGALDLVANAKNLALGAGGGVIDVRSGATLTMNDSGQWSTTGAGTLYVTNSGTGTGTAIWSNQTYSQNGPVVIGSGTGTVVFRYGANQNTSLTTTLGNGLASAFTVQPGGQLDISTATAFARSIVFQGGAVTSTTASAGATLNGTLLVQTGGGTINNAQQVTANSEIFLESGGLRLQGAGALTLNQPIVGGGTTTDLGGPGTGAYGLFVARTYSPRTDNTYTGGTAVVTGGTLSVTSDAQLSVLPGSYLQNNISLNGGALSFQASFDLNPNRGIVLGPTTGTGTGTIDVGSGFTTAYDYVLANQGAGVGGLTKTGAGTLTLPGTSAHTYTGVTTVAGGVLQVSRAAGGLGNNTTAAAITLIGGTLTVLNDGAGNNGTIVFGSAGNPNGYGVTTSTGTSTLNVGNLTANTGNTVQFGGLTLGGGTLNLTNANGYGVTFATPPTITASTVLNNNMTGRTLTLAGVAGTTGTAAALTFGGTTDITVIGDISQAAGAVSVAKTGTNTVILSGTRAYTGTTVVSSGTLTLQGNQTGTTGAITAGNVAATTGVLNIQGDVLLGGSQFNVGATAGGAVGIVNQTAGTVSFGTTGNALLIGNSAAGVSGTYNLSGGTLTAGTIANRGIIMGVNSGASGNPVLANFNLSGTGAINMSTDLLQVGRSDIVASFTTDVFAQTGGTATFGTLAVGGSSTTNSTNVTSTLTFTGGTFTAGAFTVLAGGTANAATINIGGTAIVTLAAFPTARGAGSTATVNFDGGTLIPAAASATYMGGLTNAFVKAGGIAFSVPSGRNITVTQALLTDAASTGGGLTKRDVGVLTLNGASTFTGPVVIQGGTLAVSGNLPTGAASALGASSNAAGNLILDGGNFGYSGTAAGVTDRNFTLTTNGGGLDASGTTAGTFTVTGSMTVIGTTGAQAFTLTGTGVGAAGAGTYAGQIVNGAGTNVTYLIKSGAGTWVLTGDSTFTGTTAIQNGTLSVASINRVADGSASSNLGAPATAAAGTIALGSTTTAGTLSYTGTGATTDRVIDLAGTTGGGVLDQSGTGLLKFTSNLTASGVGAKVLTLTGSSAGAGEFAGNVVNGNGTTGLTKTGTGTWTLSGANTYTGNTLVNAGTLNIAGSVTGNTTSSKINVNPTAGNTAVVNYGGGTSTLFATTGATVAGTASAFNQTAGLITVTPGTTTGTQNVVGVTGGYGYLGVTGGVYRDTTGTPGGARFTLTNQGSAAVMNTNGTVAVPSTGAGVQTGVVYVGGTGTIDHTNAEWWLSYSLGQITVADSGKIDHTGSNNPFGIFMNHAAGVTGGGYGVLNVAGPGAQVVTGGQPLRFGNSTTAGQGEGQSGFVNLAAGVLSTGANVSTSLPAAPTTVNNAFFNFAGGTVQATAPLTAFIPASNAAINFNSTVYGAINNSAVAGAPSFTGGLTVDTNSFAVTIANPLQAPGGAGVTQSDLAVTGGSGYVGPPAVVFSSAGMIAGGSPAAGYALISGGSVVGIVITSPGTYAPGTVPTITLVGGGGTGAAVTATALNTANASGGLTKIGLGTLTLSAANTYTGGTTIAAGTLAAGIANALPSSGTVTVNGGTLDVATFNNTVAAISLQSGSINGTTGVLTSGSITLQSGTVSAALGGTGGLTKSTSGTVTLSGASTFTGAVNVTGGTLGFSAGNNLGAAASTVTVDGGTLSYTGSAAVNLGAGRVVTIGSGNGTLDAANAAGTVTFPGIAAASTGNLTKTGPGAVVVGGSTSLNGGAGRVTVSGGTLQAGFGTSGISALAVGATGYLNLDNSAIEALVLGGTAGALTLAGGSQLGFELAGGGAADSIAVGAGGTALTAGTITLNFVGTVAGGTYSLLTAPGGLAAANYVLGTAPAGFAYTINKSATLVSLTAAPQALVYWTGSQDGSWSTVTGGQSNFSTDAAGAANLGAAPNATHTVVFSATSAVPVGTTIATTLDAAFTVDSLQFVAAPAGVTAVTINPGAGGSLTLAPVSTNGGILVAVNAGAVTIAAPLTVGTTQTWDVDGTGANGSSLTVSGNTTFTGGVTKTGAGAVTLSGAGTGGGGFTLSAGTLNVNSGSALGTGRLTIGVGTTIDNTSAGAVTLTTNNAQTWNGNFTFTGTQGLALGTGAVTLANTATVTTAANTLTVGGTVSDGGAGLSLAKAGTGALVLGGGVTLGGTLAVTAGTLTLNAANTVGGGVALSGGTLNLGHAAALGANTFAVSGGTLDNTSGGPLTLSTNNPVALSGILAFAGTDSLNLGTGGIALGGTSQISANANTLTVGGDVIGGQAFTKAGAGILALNGTNTFSTLTLSGGTLTLNGPTTVTAVTTTGGTLNVAANFAPSGVLTMSAGSVVNVNTGATLTLNSLNHLIGNTAGTATLVVPAGGKLAVGTGTGTLSIGPSVASGTAVGIIDASAATGPNAVVINVATLGFASTTNAAAGGEGRLLLPTSPGATSTIAAATSIVLGSNTSGGQNSNNTINFGGGTVIIDTPSLTVGGAKSGGSLTSTTNGTLTLRNGASGKVALAIGNNTAAATGTNPTSAVNLTSTNPINATVGAVTMAGIQGTTSTTVGGSTASFTLNGAANSLVTLDSITTGTQSGSFGTNNPGSNSTITVTSGTVQFNSGGTGILYGTGIAAANRTSTVNVDGPNGVLNLNNQPVYIGTPANTAYTTTVNLKNGTLANVSTLGALVANFTFNFTGGTFLNSLVPSQSIPKDLTQMATVSPSLLQVNASRATAITGVYTVNGTPANLATARVDGTLTASGGVTVGATGQAQVQGTGTVGSPLTVGAFGAVAPGNGSATGTLTVANTVALSDGSNLGWKVTTPAPGAFVAFGGTTYYGSSDAAGTQDRLAVTGTGNTIGGGDFTLKVVEPGGTGSVYLDPALPYSFTVATTQAAPTLGTVTIDLSMAPDFATYAALSGNSFSLTAVGNNLYLTAGAPVPEPAAVGLVAAAGLGLGGLVRRRSRRRA